MNFTKLFFFIFMNVCLAAVPVQAADKTLQNKDYTITIPENWTVMLDFPTRTSDDGYQILEQYYQTPDSVHNDMFFVTVSRLGKGSKVSVDEIFRREKTAAEELFNSTVQKQTSTPPCQLYFTSCYEFANPYTHKTEWMKKHCWLYQRQNVVYMLSALFDRATVTNVEKIEQIIHTIQSSFQLK